MLPVMWGLVLDSSPAAKEDSGIRQDFRTGVNQRCAGVINHANRHEHDVEITQMASKHLGHHTG